MELYTHTASSSYNETMSGETLSSVSEKSCISNNVNAAHIAPMSAAVMAANGHIPYLVSRESRDRGTIATSSRFALYLIFLT